MTKRMVSREILPGFVVHVSEDVNPETIEALQELGKAVIKMELHVFCNDVTDWVIAYNEADAIKVWEESYGEKWSDYAPVNEDLWTQEPDDQLFTLYEEELNHPQPQPDGGIVIESGEYWQKTRAPLKAWIKARGRCFLGSTEY